MCKFAGDSVKRLDHDREGRAVDRLSHADVDKMKNVLNLLSDNADAVKTFTTSIKGLSSVRSPSHASKREFCDPFTVFIVQIHPVVQATASVVLLPLQVNYPIGST